MPGMIVNVLADADVAAGPRGVPGDGRARRSRSSRRARPGRPWTPCGAGKRVITGDYALAAQLEDVDIVADVTPSPATGAETAYACIRHGKDVVMVNIEADVTVGRILKRLAARGAACSTPSRRATSRAA